MSWVTIVGFLKAILPTKKIAAWLLGILCAIVALVMGVNNSDVKAQFCANQEVVQLPPLPDKAPIPPPAPAAPIPAPAAAVKK